MPTHHFKKEIEVTLELAKKAAAATEKIRNEGITTRDKEDGTPLTQADLVSQAIILAGLKANFPDDRIFAEESMDPESDTEVRSGACDVLADLGMHDPNTHLETWVNYRGNRSGSRVWLIDPIDGTKGFVKGLSYAIAMGLCVDGKVQFGCIAAPSFPTADGQRSRTVIAYAGKGSGAYWLEGLSDRPRAIHVSDVDSPAQLRLMGSRAHDSCKICRRFKEKAGVRHFIPMDSQAKYLMLASGRADLYLRGTDPHFGIGFPWDHCAGQAILEEAGGKVTGPRGESIDYARHPGDTIKYMDGLVASNRICHGQVLDLLKDMT